MKMVHRIRSNLEHQITKMAKTFSMGNTIESRPKKTRQGKENTRNTRQHPVTRARSRKRYKGQGK